MLDQVVNFVLNFVEGAWYLWIFFMMLLESSFFPFPSEVAMVPAWALAASGKMSFLLALIAWTVWSIVWALINYVIWKYLWKKFILKYWKYFFITEEHYNKWEKYFKNHGPITTFIWRLLPVIRQYISFPAWVTSMNLAKFWFYTWLWAWIWSLILMIIWYIAWKNSDLIHEYKIYSIIWLLIFIILVTLIYLIIQKRIKIKKV